MDFLFRILLSLLNHAVSVLFGIFEFFRRLKVQILSLKHSTSSEELLESKRKFCEFEKTPGHVGVVVNEDIVSYVDIANIVVWCLALGVRNVSIYDVGGTLKLNMFTLYKEALIAKKRILKEESEEKRRISLYSSSVHENFENGFHNGYKGQENINISLLSWENGKDDLVNAARTIICKDATKQTITPPDVELINLQEHVNCLPGFPDPDVIVCFGGGKSLGGYLPWHIRLTEFTFYQTHRNFRLKELMQVFAAYSKCEQRVGK